jgi:two-component system, sensor histidine kinase RegB
MSDIADTPGSAPPRAGWGLLRLPTLVRLRWLAIAGQLAAVAVVGLWFGFSMPFLPVLALIALSAVVNVGLRIFFPGSRRLDPTWATAVLAYDILQLSGLLYLTGGLLNPFAILLLVPVMVAAATLEPDHTFLLGIIVILAATVLVFYHWPLPWYPGEELHLPMLYSLGLWVALVCALAFMAFYASRVAAEARQLNDALTAAELVLQREHHLSALDGLAAAAAHELGTPLATIALVAKELEKEIPPDSPHAEDVQLLRDQSQRCREILAKLTSLSSHPDEHLGPMPLSHLLENVAAPHREFGVSLKVAAAGAGPEPVSSHNPGLVYGLGNLVENAVDFAESEVELEADWDESVVRVTIADDGPGFADDVIGRLGEPYVTTRGAARRGDGEQGGLGLGVFIAKTLLERSGARLTLANRRSPERGAVVTVRWPRASFDSRAAPPARAAE